MGFSPLPSSSHPLWKTLWKNVTRMPNASVMPYRQTSLSGLSESGRRAQRDEFGPGDALRNVEILYVDDESHRRDAMRRMLMSLGARRVQVAESGAEGLKVVLGTTYGLVIVEQEMKPMDGIAFVRELRSAVNYPRALVPALIFSDPASTDVIKAALGAGANHFLVKPISPAKLYERIGWAIADARPFVVRNGHYVIRPAKKAEPVKVAAAK
jgi:CheY-like chemotaxis protein